MHFILRISKSARADLVSIPARIAQDNPVAAFRFLEAVQETEERIARWPRSGKLVEDGRFRIVPVHRFRDYIVLWEVKTDCVEIKRIFHGGLDHNRVVRTIRP